MRCTHTMIGMVLAAAGAMQALGANEEVHNATAMFTPDSLEPRLIAVPGFDDANGARVLKNVRINVDTRWQIAGGVDNDSEVQQAAVRLEVILGAIIGLPDGQDRGMTHYWNSDWFKLHGDRDLDSQSGTVIDFTRPDGLDFALVQDGQPVRIGSFEVDASSATGAIATVVELSPVFLHSNLEWDPAPTDQHQISMDQRYWFDVEVVYTWQRGCPADFDTNAELDSADFFGFLDAWLQGDAAADLDGSGRASTSDFFTYLNAFIAGC